MKTYMPAGPWELMQVSRSFRVCTPQAEAFVESEHYLAGEPFIAEVNDDFHKAGEKVTREWTAERRRRIEETAQALQAVPDMIEALRLVRKYESQLPPGCRGIVRGALNKATDPKRRKRLE